MAFLIGVGIDVIFLRLLNRINTVGSGWVGAGYIKSESANLYHWCWSQELKQVWLAGMGFTNRWLSRSC